MEDNPFKWSRRVIRTWTIFCAGFALYVFFAGENVQGDWGFVVLVGLLWLGGGTATGGTSPPHPVCGRPPHRIMIRSLTWL